MLYRSQKVTSAFFFPVPRSIYYVLHIYIYIYIPDVTHRVEARSNFHCGIPLASSLKVLRSISSTPKDVLVLTKTNPVAAEYKVQHLSHFQHPKSSKVIPLMSILMLYSHLLDFASKSFHNGFHNKILQAFLPCLPIQVHTPNPLQSPQFHCHEKPWWFIGQSTTFLALTISNFSHLKFKHFAETLRLRLEDKLTAIFLSKSDTRMRGLRACMYSGVYVYVCITCTV